MHDIAIGKLVMLYIGIAAALVAVWMTFSYGRTMSFAHGVSMGLLTLVAAFIWTAADHYRKIGQKYAGTALMVLGVLFTTVEYFSHIGYTVGNRVTVTEEVGIVNTAYQQNQDAVTEDKANLEMWRKQLADLKEQNAWTASVTADGLRANLASADKAIELETKRGGCKSKCLALMEKKADLESRIATAEQVGDLSKRIEATQRILDGKRTTATKSEFKSSPIVNQTKFAAQLATQEIEPSKEAMNWTQILIGALIAFVTTFLAPTCFYIVFGDQKADPYIADVWKRQAERNAAPTTLKAQPASEKAHVFGVRDERALKKLEELASRVEQNRQAYGAAA